MTKAQFTLQQIVEMAASGNTEYEDLSRYAAEALAAQAAPKSMPELARAAITSEAAHWGVLEAFESAFSAPLNDEQTYEVGEWVKQMATDYRSASSVTDAQIDAAVKAIEAGAALAQQAAIEAATAAQPTGIDLAKAIVATKLAYWAACGQFEQNIGGELTDRQGDIIHDWANDYAAAVDSADDLNESDYIELLQSLGVA